MKWIEVAPYTGEKLHLRVFDVKIYLKYFSLINLYSKTVTWADDLDNNYKKFETSQGFEKQDTEIIEDTGAFYGDENQQQQSEYSASEYLDDGGGGGGDGDGSGGVGNDIIESSNTQNQYDENQYQAQVVDETNQNVYNNEYYYPDQQLNQYEQYEAQQKQEVWFCKQLQVFTTYFASFSLI